MQNRFLRVEGLSNRSGSGGPSVAYWKNVFGILQRLMSTAMSSNLMFAPRKDGKEASERDNNLTPRDVYTRAGKYNIPSLYAVLPSISWRRAVGGRYILLWDRTKRYRTGPQRHWGAPHLLLVMFSWWPSTLPFCSAYFFLIMRTLWLNFHQPHRKQQREMLEETW